MIAFCKLRAKKILKEEKREGRRASLLCRKHKKPSKYAAYRECEVLREAE
jgi:hypothetical protein